MQTTRDTQKARRLRDDCGIDIRELADLSTNGKYTAILRNPSRPSQFIFVIPHHDYTHVVPFVVAEDDMIVLKNVYPSRRFHHLSGVSNEDKT